MYCISIDMATTYYLYSLTDQTLAINLQEILVDIEFVFLLVVYSTSSLFYGTAIVFSCLDQIKVAKQLRKVVAELVSLNSLRFHGSSQPP